jgi:TetR/AcrR family transcriptional regulator
LDEYLAKRRQIERNDRVLNILEAGRKVFIKKGYFGTTVRDIAREAGLSTGAIYFYFKGKDDLYGKICEEAFYIMLELARKATHTEGNALDRLNAICKAYLKFYTDYTEYFDLISFKDLGFKAVGLSDEQLANLEKLSRESISILHRPIADGINEGLISDTNKDSYELTFVVWAGVEGIIFLHKRGYLDMYGLNIPDLLNQLLNNLIYGFTPNVPNP